MDLDLNINKKRAKLNHQMTYTFQFSHRMNVGQIKKKIKLDEMSRSIGKNK